MSRKNGMNIYCLSCGISKYISGSRKTKYCSKNCYTNSQVGRKLLPHVKDIALSNLRNWALKRVANAPKGENNNKWKGDIVGYRALHYWVERQLGKARLCSICGKSEGRMHWANIDHSYRRNTNDYFSACPSCHKAYDKKLKEKK